MPHKPMVSVITTVFNGAEDIERAINSIREQTITDWEYVIVDDGSTDNTVAVIDRIAALDERIKLIACKRLGRATALNVAWRASHGDYIANLDADDFAMPERLEEQLAYLRAHPEVGVVGAICGQTRDGSSVDGEIRNPLTNSEIQKALIFRSPIVHSAAMMRRSALETVGGYDESYPVAIDYDLWSRLSLHYELANLPNMLVIRRMSGQRFFRFKVSVWQRTRAITSIRWRVWKNHSRNLSELPYVMIDPFVQSSRIRLNTVFRR